MIDYTPEVISNKSLYLILKQAVADHPNRDQLEFGFDPNDWEFFLTWQGEVPFRLQHPTVRFVLNMGAQQFSLIDLEAAKKKVFTKLRIVEAKSHV